ncbi:hypothetical protein EDD22DRAFT_876591 [Suillus occidentalis]|nr:hypothetical protein EDD22DRAFT_876591 [Suillus occidentalis]
MAPMLGFGPCVASVCLTQVTMFSFPTTHCFCVIPFCWLPPSLRSVSSTHEKVPNITQASESVSVPRILLSVPHEGHERSHRPDFCAISAPYLLLHKEGGCDTRAMGGWDKDNDENSVVP